MTGYTSVFEPDEERLLDQVLNEVYESHAWDGVVESIDIGLAEIFDVQLDYETNSEDFQALQLRAMVRLAEHCLRGTDFVVAFKSDLGLDGEPSVDRAGEPAPSPAELFEAYFGVADEIYESLKQRPPLKQDVPGDKQLGYGSLFLTLADLDTQYVEAARRFVDQYAADNRGVTPPWPPYLPWAEEYLNDLRNGRAR